MSQFKSYPNHCLDQNLIDSNPFFCREKFQDWPDAAAVIKVKEEDMIIARALADDGASGEIEVSLDSFWNHGIKSFWGLQITIPKFDGSLG